MATGIIIRDMDSPSVLKYPSGVNAMIKMIAVIRASSTI
jgi:hypothetical protein